MSKKINTLAVGAKVRDPLSKYYGVPVGFQIADKNHAGYPANSTTLAAEKILCLKAFDAKESGGNSDRQNYGNNRYSLANIRQWLNKSGTNWYQAQHSYDRAPGSSYVWNGYNAYDTEAGFKTGFSPQFLAAILPTTLTVAKPTTDGGGSETVTDDFFLPSKQEVGLGSENGIAEDRFWRCSTATTAPACAPARRRPSQTATIPTTPAARPTGSGGCGPRALATRTASASSIRTAASSTTSRAAAASASCRFVICPLIPWYLTSLTPKATTRFSGIRPRLRPPASPYRTA